ncbi:hypothetical protein Tco_1152130 [Tanacetum coccineum]
MSYTTTPRQITRSTPPSHRPHLQSSLPTSLPPSQPRTITIVIISTLPTATPPRLPSPHHRTINTKATTTATLPLRRSVWVFHRKGAYGLGCLDTKEGALVGVMVCTSMVLLVLVLTPLRVRLDLRITRQKGAFGSAYERQQGAFGLGYNSLITALGAFGTTIGAFGLSRINTKGVFGWFNRTKGAFGII